MVMLAQPIFDAYISIREKLDYKPRVIYMSPQGRKLDQSLVEELSQYEHIILLCGHYEGVDERVLEEIVDEEISIGDYVLTGGELPAMVLIDAVCRTIPGVLSNEGLVFRRITLRRTSGVSSIYKTRLNSMNRKVPDILMSGHHANIKKWRRQQSLLRTLEKGLICWRNSHWSRKTENCWIRL